jgi:hypothetical protein
MMKAETAGDVALIEDIKAIFDASAWTGSAARG